MTQLHLFPTVIREIHLAADSPKKAFWRLMLIEDHGRYHLRKDSGIYEKVLDRRIWPQHCLKSALKTFDQKVNQKLRATRKSPRKYEIKYCNY